MTTLILGSKANLLSTPRNQDVLIVDDAILTKDYLGNRNISRLISFGYRRKVPEDVIHSLPGGAFNIHISLLPWNRGSNPNFWSWFDHTPKGVTIHEMHADLDTGHIVAQRHVELRPSETLRSSYEKLVLAAAILFEEISESVFSNSFDSQPQPPGGSLHTMSDFDKFSHLLTLGWDTPCSFIEQAGHVFRKTSQKSH